MLALSSDCLSTECLWKLSLCLILGMISNAATVFVNVTASKK